MSDSVTSAKPGAATPAAAPEAVVRIEGLSKSFDGRLVLDDVHLEVPRGRIVSVIGQSGGGKTTLMRCVNLLERPDRGTVEVAGEVVHQGGRTVCRDLARLRRTVGMVFQRFNLFPHLTAVENVVLAQRKAGVPEPQALERAVALLRRVKVAHRALALPDQLSGGEQQRVAIARALALTPEVLLFDEPTSSLDPEATREVLSVMRELAADGMTMLLVTHELPFAREVSDHVVFVDGGRIVEEGRPEEVLDRPARARTREFLASYGTTS
ncbi:amino acid ABC transporter ATP-binding protein [Streptomyces sp. DSM 3412]|uniref:Amino acid ABC transporter ATP-binding protein n=1 Tax=Streptomyces gottesmaniae TaxID=3075518 RepID=A0ABU2Z467_9ACTN|nr:amino acid ABC transporter ATP-binding protein [Streptomyces sp. DSM 3412]MDT0571376.1 amino acid ABC transporter ATP-binding protein [Streptomyces sp. DSM 3412]